MKVEARARGASVEVRTVTLTKALLKQCRQFSDVPPKPYAQVVTGQNGSGHVEVLTEFAVGWFRGSVLGDDDHDYVLFAKDGDLVLGKFWRNITRWKMPPTCKQLYL